MAKRQKAMDKWVDKNPAKASLIGAGLEVGIIGGISYVVASNVYDKRNARNAWNGAQPKKGFFSKINPFKRNKADDKPAPAGAGTDTPSDQQQ